MSHATTFVHLVYFYTRPDGPADAAEKIAAGCHAYLGGIPGALRVEVGVPAGTPRDVVDNSYGVALLVEFTDQAAHDAYQSHPDHIRFIEECRAYWARVQVYDSLMHKAGSQG